MISELETLLVLNQQKTMVKTATYLRITQSAVSKRIQSLENHFKVKLVKRSGRNLIFTDDGLHLVNKARPLIGNLNELLKINTVNQKQTKIILGVAESVLIGWFSKFLCYFCEKYPSFEIEIHTHRSPVVSDHVLSGRYDAGIVSGDLPSANSLVFESILVEPLVVVSNNLALEKGKFLDVYTIEKHSFSYKTISTGLKKEKKIKIAGYLESFAGLAILAKEGFLNALLPITIAKSLNIRAEHIYLTGKINRKISLISRKYNFNDEPITLLIKEIGNYVSNNKKQFGV